MVSLNLRTVHDALTHALNGIKLSDGSSLFCSNTRANLDSVGKQFPAIILKTGRLQTQQWRQFLTKNIVDIPATLKVEGKGLGQGQETIKTVLEDLTLFLERVRGLPVDKDTGIVVPFSSNTGRLYDRKQLINLANLDGPWFSSIRVNDQADANFSTAEITIHVEFLAEHDPEIKSLVKVVEIGLPEIDWYQNKDSTLDPALAIPVVTNADIVAQGVYDTGLPNNNDQGRLVTRDFPFPDAIPHSDRANSGDVNASILLVPGPTATVKAGNTLQLQTILFFADSSTANITGAASYSTSDPTKATVNTSGLVTGVALGTASITAAFQGLNYITVVTVN